MILLLCSIMHFVNIHLFHDESNFVAMEKVQVCTTLIEQSLHVHVCFSHLRATHRTERLPSVML